MRNFGLCAAFLLAGCFVSPDAPAPGEPAGVIGARTMQTEQQFQAMARQAQSWGKEVQAPAVIGGTSTFERGAAASRGTSDTSLAELAREVRVLSARVERLERNMAGSAAQAPAAAIAGGAPVASIYQVSPDGQTAWVSVGSSSGIKEGQSFQVKRGATVVAQVQVVRVWPQVSELSVLWASGTIQRGDQLVAVAAPVGM